MFIQWLAKIIVALNANTRPVEIGLGISFAFWLGIIPFNLPAMPLFNLLWLALFLIAFFIKINQAIFMVFLAIFKLLAPVIYPLSAWLGYAVLTVPELYSFFTSLNEIPLLFFTYFNSPLVMGGFLLGLFLFGPLSLIASLLVRLYREKLRERIAHSKLVKAFFQIPLVKKISELLGGAISFYQGLRG